MTSVMLDWNQQYQCEILALDIYVQPDRQRNKNKCVCAYYYKRECLEAMISQYHLLHLVPRSQFPNTILQLKEPGVPRNKVGSGAVTGQKQDELKHVEVPESKKLLKKKNTILLEEQRANLKELPPKSKC